MASIARSPKQASKKVTNSDKSGKTTASQQGSAPNGKADAYLLAEKINTLIEKHKDIIEKKAGDPTADKAKSSSTKEGLIKKALDRKKFESLELNLDVEEAINSNKHKEAPNSTKPEAKKEIHGSKIDSRLANNYSRKEKNFSTEPSPQSAGGEGKYFMSRSVKASNLLSPFQERKNNTKEKKRLNQISLEIEKGHLNGLNEAAAFNNEKCEIISTKSSCHSATLKSNKHNNAHAVYYIPVESRDFKSNLYFTTMKRELQDYFRTFRARQLEKAKLLTANERAYYEKLMQEDSENKLLEYFDKEAMKRLSTLVNVEAGDYPSPDDIKELERLKLDPKSIFFAWLLQNQRTLDRHHFTPVLQRKYSDDASGTTTSKKKEASLESAKPVHLLVDSPFSKESVGRSKDSDSLKPVLSSQKNPSPPSTCPKKGTKSKKHDNIKTPTKKSIPEPKTEGYAETKKPEYMKKDIKVEVSDFKEDNQPTEPELDEFEKRIAEKIESRIRNFLMAEERRESPALDQEKPYPARTGLGEPLEGHLSEKSKNITVKSLMTMKNFLKPGSLVLAVASGFLSLFAGVVSDIPLDFTKSYTKNLKEIKKIFSSPGSLIAGMNSFAHLVREGRIPEDNITHSSEILEMSKSLTFTADIPSFVQENIKKLSEYIQAASNFCHEAGKSKEPAQREKSKDEKAREEFFAQFRKSDPNVKSEAFENPRQLNISPEMKSSIKAKNKPLGKNGAPTLSPGNSKDEKTFPSRKSKNRLEQLLGISTKKPEVESVVKLYLSKSIDQKFPVSTQQALHEKKQLEEQVNTLKKDMNELMAKNSKIEWQLERERKKMQKLEEQRKMREEIEHNNQVNKKFQEDMKRKEFEEREQERFFREQELRKSREFKEINRLKRQEELKESLKINSIHEQKEAGLLKSEILEQKTSPKKASPTGKRNFEEQYQLAKDQDANQYEDYLRKKTNSLSWHQREMLTSKEQLEKHYNKTLNLISNNSEKK